MNPIREAAKRLPGNWYQNYYFYDNDLPAGWQEAGIFPQNFCGLGMTAEIIAEQYDTHFWETEKPREYYDDQQKAWDILNNLACEQYPDRTNGKPNFPNFNDHPDTTEEEVIAILEKGAVMWDELYG